MRILSHMPILATIHIAKSNHSPTLPHTFDYTTDSPHLAFGLFYALLNIPAYLWQCFFPMSGPGIWNTRSEIFDDMRMRTTKSRMLLYPSFALSVLNMSTQFNESV